MDKNSFYPIRAVAKLVGMTTDSIRAWERRYGAIKPARSRGGRLYSDYDVQRLMLLKKAVDHGHSIGQIARLEDNALKNLPMDNGAENERSKHRKRMEEREIGHILTALKDYDAVSADRLLGSLAALQPPRDFIYTLVLPLMRKVGEMWHNGELNIAQEHMLSAMLRSVLGTLLRVNSKETPSHSILFTTLPGEHHEFGVLSAAMLTAGAGLNAIYLGTDTPLKDVLDALERTKTQSLVLSMMADEERNERHLEFLKDLYETVPDTVDVILGGWLTDSVAANARTMGFYVFPEMKAFEQYLLDHGGKF